MIFIWAKIGTHPTYRYRAMRKRKKPVVGDRLVLREHEAWEDMHVRVTEIKEIDGQPLYYVEKF